MLKYFTLLIVLMIAIGGNAQLDTIFTKKWAPIAGAIEKEEKRYLYIQRENTKTGVLYPVKKNQITHVRYKNGNITYYNPLTEKVELTTKLELNLSDTNEASVISNDSNQVSESKKEDEEPTELAKEETNSMQTYFESYKTNGNSFGEISELKINLLAPLLGIGIQVPVVQNRLYFGAEFNTSFNLDVYRNKKLAHVMNHYRPFHGDLKNFSYNGMYSHMTQFPGNYRSTLNSGLLTAKLYLLPLEWKLKGFLTAGMGASMIQYYHNIRYLSLDFTNNNNGDVIIVGNNVNVALVMANTYFMSIGTEYRFNSNWSVGASVQFNTIKYYGTTSELHYENVNGASRSLGGQNEHFVNRNVMVPIFLLYHF